MNIFYYRVVYTALFIIGFTSVFAQKLPIKPERTIAFDTDEGSYMNIDVSPDGNTLVFDLLGQLFTVPATGGKATQITKGIALHINPVWSQDGGLIAYLSDTSGVMRLVIRNIRGTYSYISREPNPEIHDTDYPIPMKKEFGVNIQHKIFFKKLDHRDVIACYGNGRDIYYWDSRALCLFDTLTKTQKTLTPGLRYCYRSALSPDANLIACVIDSNNHKALIIHDIHKNTDQLLLPSLVEHSELAGPSISHFAFSPDSKNLFISYRGKIHKINPENGADQIIPFLAHVESALGPFNYHTFRVKQGPMNVRYTRYACKSPDEKHLLFSALARLYTMDLPNGKVRRFNKQSLNQFQPVYSPDGKWVAYVTWSDTAGGALWKVSSLGGEPKRLTFKPGQYQRPAWSPDGSQIAVIKGPLILGNRDDPGQGQLQLVAAAGSMVRAITDSIPLWNQLAFSNNGKRIIFIPKPGTGGVITPQLCSINLAGQDQQVIATGLEPPFLNSPQKTISPDGRYLVCSADEDLYLISLINKKLPVNISDKDHPLKGLKFAPGVDPQWKNGGKKLTWTYGDHFFQVDPDKVSIAEHKESGKLANHSYQSTRIRLNVPSSYAHGIVALENVRIITMRGMKVIEHGTIIITNGRFAAIGTKAKVHIPKNAKVFRLQGKTIMPGLIDIHDHMRVGPDIFPQQSWMFLANLAYGVTTARDPSDSFDSFGYAELLRTGQMLGPRLFTVGRAARIPDGMISCNSLDDTKSLVQKRALLGGSEIKQYTLPTREQKQWLLMASRGAGLNMTNEGAHDAIEYLGMIRDGSTGVEHNPIWADVYKDVISLIAKSGTYVTPTLQVCCDTHFGKEYFDYKYWRHPGEKLRRFLLSEPSRPDATMNSAETIEAIMNASPVDTVAPSFLIGGRIDVRIHKQGGMITLGGHGEDQGIGSQNELWALQMSGLTTMEALQAATINGAKALGIQRDLGSIEVGKIADLLILSKNPLDDIHNSREISYVMKDGVLYNGDTLDEIWPVAKKCPQWRLNTQLQNTLKK